ncbi:MAG: response regulator [Thermodesulfobacteriota bacterium]
MKKVLLVDDIRLFLEIEQTLLNRPDVTIFTATSGEEALRIHERENVDVILLDLLMPGMDGEKVCQYIRADDRLRNVSIIMVTTSTAPEDIERCKKAGANDYVVKPINPTELLTKFQKYINIATRRDLRILARVDVAGTNDVESFIGNTVNISASGVLVECTQRLDLGDAVSCSFSLPGNTATVTSTGEVVRAKEIDHSQHHIMRYGIRFIDIGEEDKNMIESFISRYSDKTSTAQQPQN